MFQVTLQHGKKQIQNIQHVFGAMIHMVGSSPLVSHHIPPIIPVLSMLSVCDHPACAGFNLVYTTSVACRFSYGYDLYEKGLSVLTLSSSCMLLIQSYNEFKKSWLIKRLETQNMNLWKGSLGLEWMNRRYKGLRNSPLVVGSKAEIRKQDGHEEREAR